MDSLALNHAAADTVDAPVDDGTAAAQYFEYSKAANPVRASLTPHIPFDVFPASLYADGPTRVVPLDISAQLKCASPATGPDLCANFIRILDGEHVTLEPNATSMVFYAIRGSGTAQSSGETLRWSAGDFFTTPGSGPTRLAASADAALYYVNDAPLLT